MWLPPSPASLSTSNTNLLNIILIVIILVLVATVVCAHVHGIIRKSSAEKAKLTPVESISFKPKLKKMKKKKKRNVAEDESQPPEKEGGTRKAALASMVRMDVFKNSSRIVTSDSTGEKTMKLPEIYECMRIPPDKLHMCGEIGSGSFA